MCTEFSTVSRDVLLRNKPIRRPGAMPMAIETFLVYTPNMTHRQLQRQSGADRHRKAWSRYRERKSRKIPNARHLEGSTSLNRDHRRE